MTTVRYAVDVKFGCSEPSESIHINSIPARLSILATWALAMFSIGGSMPTMSQTSKVKTGFCCSNEGFASVNGTATDKPKIRLTVHIEVTAASSNELAFIEGRRNTSAKP